MILGVDFSHWQGKPDCAKLANNGVKFAIVKAGEVAGIRKPINPSKPLFFDDKHDRNITQLQLNGILCGDYYYFHPSAGASKQARHYASIYNRFDLNFPPVIDIEDTDGYKPADVAKQLFAFIEQLRELTGKMPWLYSRNGFIVNQIGDPNWPVGMKFWIARYSNKIGDLSLKIRNDVIMWQFTDRIKIPGLPTMDGNYWMASEKELYKYSSEVTSIDTTGDAEEVKFRLGIGIFRRKIETILDSLR